MSSKFSNARKVDPRHRHRASPSSRSLSGLSGWVFESRRSTTRPTTREVFGGIPTALVVVFYIVVPILIIYGAVLFAERTKNWERGRPDNRATTAKNVKRRLERLPGRRLHADPAARPGRRHHALADLLQLPGAAGASPRCSRSTTSCPTSLKFLHGRSTGLRVRRRRRRPGVRSSASCGRIVRRYVQRPVPHPHQDQARARRDPRHVPALSA